MSSKCRLRDLYFLTLLDLWSEFVDPHGDTDEFDECFRKSYKLTTSQTSLCRYSFQVIYSMWYPGVQIGDIRNTATQLVECIPDFDDYEKSETAQMILQTVFTLPRRRNRYRPVPVATL